MSLLYGESIYKYYHCESEDTVKIKQIFSDCIGNIERNLRIDMGFELVSNFYVNGKEKDKFYKRKYSR